MRMAADGVETNVLLMKPRMPMILDAARRERLRGNPSLNEADRWILGQIEDRRREGFVVVLRGANDEGDPCWKFDPAFSDDEIGELGALVIRALLPFHRRVLAIGINLFVHSEWGGRETGPMRRGLLALCDEIERSEADPGLRALDLWILKNMLLFTSLPTEHVVETTLPLHLRFVASRRTKVDRLLGAVDPAVFG